MVVPSGNGGGDGNGRHPGQPSLGTAISNMAGTIDGIIARQRLEWERQRQQVLERGGSGGGGSGNGNSGGSGGGGSERPAHHGGNGMWLDIRPEAAVPIPDIERPRRIAYVDGGNATLLGSPGWSVGFNTVCYTIWHGDRRHKPRCTPRVDFLTLLAAEPDDSGNGNVEGDIQRPRRYALRSFPVGGGVMDGTDGDADGDGDKAKNRPPSLDAQCIPTDADMGSIDGVGGDGGGENEEDDDDDGGGGSGSGGDNRTGTPDHALDTRRPATEHNRSRMMSVPRAFAEWKMAAAVVRTELEKNDVIVMDGTLQTGYAGEARLAAELYELARRKGVVVCALAKTTTLMVPGGIPVLYAAQEAARAAGHRTWYMPLARRVSGDGSGFVLAVRLHRQSRFTYRLEILRDQYDALVDSDALGEVIGSIAANSGDASFPGYPYGLISADRHARVRGTEAGIYRRMLLNEFQRCEHGRTMVDHAELLSAHKTLNRAVGG